LEEQGIPTVNVTTTEFIKAAQAQCAALGMPQYEPILVTHPIQPKTEEEVRALADQVVDQIVTKLLRHKAQQAA
jgi:alkanesulfonate monooxygenase SsuD/methylene tetrahydromethanopterin reductase-like flavin-dependent oxidoreductase (luciferase family)